MLWEERVRKRTNISKGASIVENIDYIPSMPLILKMGFSTIDVFMYRTIDAQPQARGHDGGISMSSPRFKVSIFDDILYPKHVKLAAHNGVKPQRKSPVGHFEV